ncbi:tol-pal system protein YbgF [Flocculibacter collagenilyticus]|uniref:tol-pal system protein YbgF n=1 Tax=Flocculibacter collagenilyticus TaxID=2744479 RepID=UPI002D7FECD1|nr:tol-pal system protein YbgF [Flocculibacter collagenilyticus]
MAAPAPVSDATGSSLEKRLETIERILTARNKAQIQLQQQIDLIQDEVNEVRGVTELHTHKLEQLLERQRELYQEIDKRVSAAYSQPTVNYPSQQTPTVDSSGYSGSMSENEAYDRAVNLVLKDRNYDQAIPEFKQFLKAFPSSAYSPNAHYWLGQLLFNKNELAEAKTQFERVVSGYPDSNKRSDALLKLGAVAQKLGKKAEAKAYFERVIAEYPESTVAGLAQSRLKTLR